MKSPKCVLINPQTTILAIIGTLTISTIIGGHETARNFIDKIEDFMKFCRIEYKKPQITKFTSRR